MESLCIKNNNKDIISYLFSRISALNLDQLYVTNNEFKSFDNVIVHSKSDNIDLFYDKISSILTDTILDFYEEKLLKRILEYNYFYFTAKEKKKIIELAVDFLDNDTISKEDNYFSIYYPISDYIRENKSLVLDGFVNFRLQNYMKNLDYVIDISVNKFLIEKEYNEFVNILRLHVSCTPPNVSIIHLVYYNNETILLDEEKNVIETTDNILKAKYLSDITFSSNDYALNTLLNLLPKKLIIHLADGKEDEFINTLKLIFDGHIEICSECKICSFYKSHSTLLK